jgi:hypothetical protein
MIRIKQIEKTLFGISAFCFDIADDSDVSYVCLNSDLTVAESHGNRFVISIAARKLREIWELDKTPKEAIVCWG